MSEPRKPIFGFLWPRPDPNAPVDDAYRQVRRVRVTPRGPIRIVGLGLLTLFVAVTAGSVLMGAAAVGLTALTVVLAAVVATAVLLMLRGWVVGTYVTDDALTIESTWRLIRVPWSDVAGIERVPRPGAFLGIPMRIPSQCLVVRTRDGRTLATHVYSTSPDLWLRPEAFDMACLRLERWQTP